MKQRFEVLGMNCGACAAHVERAVKKLSGVISVSVNLLMNSMVVEFADSLTSDDIISTVNKAGYRASLNAKSVETAEYSNADNDESIEYPLSKKRETTEYSNAKNVEKNGQLRLVKGSEFSVKKAQFSAVNKSNNDAKSTAESVKKNTKNAENSGESVQKNAEINAPKATKFSAIKRTSRPESVAENNGEKGDYSCAKNAENGGQCQINSVENAEYSATNTVANAALPTNKSVHKTEYSATNSAKKTERGHAKTETEKRLDDDQRQIKIRLIVSLCLLVPLMYISMGHMLKFPLPAFLHGTKNSMTFALVQFLLTLPIVLINRSFFIRGAKAVLRKAPNMDSLVALGAGAAFLYGIVAMFVIGSALGHGDLKTADKFAMDLYFESAATILTFISAGKLLEARSKGRAAGAIHKLMDLAPKTACVLRGVKGGETGGTLSGTEEIISINLLKKGDLVVVRTGQSIPADGIIIEGSAAVDESAVTGESLPVDKTVGSSVTAGTINTGGYFVFRATRVGEDTTLSQIIRLVADASASKAPVQKLADKVSGIFVPIVLILAAVSGAAWLIAGYNIGFALRILISVLVISCPCALGLATPAAIMTGTGRAAEMGILFKTAESLEGLHKCDVIILDKTGTVTEGRPEVTDIVAFEQSENEVLRLAASVEKLSEHPLATAVVKAAERANIQLTPAMDFAAFAGFGIEASVENKRISIGNFAMAQKQKTQQNPLNPAISGNICDSSKEQISQQNPLNPAILDNIFDKAEQLASHGKTVLFVLCGGQCLGLLAIADVIKPDSRAAVDALKKMGKQVIMLTGDNRFAATAVANQAGIDIVRAEVKPADKEQTVREFQSQGKKVAMIGDGINDAPALTRADCGIAIGAGTDIAIDSADVVLISSRLSSAVTAIELSHASLKNIKQNLFWAFFYNAICIPLAAGVLYPFTDFTLSPMIAAAAMSVSSVFVVLNALRLKLFKPKKIGGNTNESR